MRIAITGIGLTSGLGDGVSAHAAKISAGTPCLSSLGGLLGEESEFSQLSASWIKPEIYCFQENGRQQVPCYCMW